MNQQKILIKFPSRQRKDKFFACLANITENIGIDDYSIQATLDIDDSAMNTAEVRDRISQYPKVKAYWGTAVSKIHAVNKDMEFAVPFDILMVHSDDMWFIKEGFGESVLKAFENWDGLVHFPDQVAGNKLITYPMMHRNLYERLGWIYQPRFNSVYADNHQQDVCRYLKKYKFVDEKILEHRHYMWGFGEMDELLKKTEDPVNYEKDRLTYHELLANNFGL